MTSVSALSAKVRRLFGSAMTRYRRRDRKIAQNQRKHRSARSASNANLGQIARKLDRGARSTTDQLASRTRVWSHSFATRASLCRLTALSSSVEILLVKSIVHGVSAVVRFFAKHWCQVLGQVWVPRQEFHGLAPGGHNSGTTSAPAPIAK